MDDIPQIRFPDLITPGDAAIDRRNLQQNEQEEQPSQPNEQGISFRHAKSVPKADELELSDRSLNSL